MLVHVEPGATVRGVVRVDGDAPCPIGKVVLGPAPGSSLPRVSALLDVEGNVVFEAVPAGLYSSIAVCDGYGQIKGPALDVPEAGIEGVVWRFEPGGNVTVVARTTAGSPADQTWIDLQPASPETARPDARALPVSSGWTDEQGVIRLQGVKQGEYLINGPDLAKPVPVTIRAGDSRFEITLAARGYVDVRVTTANGRPHDDLGIVARRVDASDPPNQGRRYDTGR